MDTPPPAPAIDSTGETWDGTQLLDALTTSAHWLEQHVETLNALNVFPVPDGDTGTNMALTLNGVVRDVAPDPSAAVVAERVSYWALMHGRGNSGIILSQILRGIGQSLAGHHRLGPREMASALAQASATAYQAILRPVEGTMLTVIREASHAAAGVIGAGHTSLELVLDAAVRGARSAVARTPALLKTLRDAGVVDAGGQGLLIVLEGLLRYARSEPVSHRSPISPPTHTPEPQHGPDAYGYCTNFVIVNPDREPNLVRAALAPLGESLVAAGDTRLVKIHIHTQHPGEVLSAALAIGALDRVEITNMDLQHSTLQAPMARQARAIGEGLEQPAAPDEPALGIGVVAVAPGAGFASIFRDLGASVVPGGPGANPSAGDLLAAIERLGGRDVIILPNDPNIVAAAQLAAHQCERAAVVETRSAPQGVAALLRLQPDGDLDANKHAMAVAAGAVRTLSVTVAARDAFADGVPVAAGQTIGLVEGVVVVAGDDEGLIVLGLLDRAGVDTDGLLTLYYGEGVDRTRAEELASWIADRRNDLEIEVHEGGQSLYNYILSFE